MWITTAKFGAHWLTNGGRRTRLSPRVVAACATAVLCVAALARSDHADNRDLARLQVVTVTIADETAREALIALDVARADMEIWEDDLGREALEVRVSPAARQALDARGFRYLVVIDDLAAWQAELLGGARDGDFFDVYRTYDEHVAFLNDLAAAYPELATIVDLGPTVEGRRQWAIRITGTGEEKPGVFYIGAQHGDEAVNPAVLAYVARHLLTNYGVDPKITDVVDNIEWWLLPIMNADNYLSGRENSNGVDLNRNWGGPGSNPNPFSEPETANLERFFLAHPNIKGFIDFHSNGNLIMWPWGHLAGHPPDHHTYGSLAYAMAKDIFDAGGDYYGRRGPILKTLYPVNGGSCDYTYGVHGIWSLTYEVNRSKHVPPEMIRPTCESLLPSVLRYTDWLWDCNGDRVGDVRELADGAPDCNGNSTPDYCEWQADCDDNGVIDVCQEGNTLPDCANLKNGQTLHVPREYATIQDAIDVAGDTSTIVVADGTYRGYGNKNLNTGNSAWRVHSRHGPRNCILDLEGFERSFQYNNIGRDDTMIGGFTIRNGRGRYVFNGTHGGGGIATRGVVYNCIIADNATDEEGGGAWGGSYYNCLFMNNAAQEGGAASAAELFDCTIVGNRSERPGGGILDSKAISCIIRGNVPDQIAEDDGVTYSNVEGGWPGRGNIDLDPAFADPERGDFRLLDGSPSINAGRMDDRLLNTSDLDGGPRIQACAVDMGAYESPFGNPECACTWSETMKLKCRRGKPEGSRIAVRLGRGVPGAEVTLRFDRDPETDTMVLLNDSGKLKYRAKGWPRGDLRVAIVECLLEQRTSCP